LLANVPLKGLPAGASLLAERTALVVGLGAAGGPTFEQLARLGVGTLWGVDPDRYGPESVLTQPSLYEHAGQPKATVQGERARRINPAIDVRTAVGVAQDIPLSILRQADLFIAAADNLEVVVWLGRIAAGLGKRMLQASVEGHTWTATVRAYGLDDPLAACPTCGMSVKERQSLRHRFGCDPARAVRDGGEATRTLPAVCLHASTLAVSEAIKGWMDVGAPPLRGAEYTHCLLTHRGYRSELPRDANCAAPHRRWSLCDVGAASDAMTPAMLADRLGLSVYQPLLQVRGEVPWVSFGLCGQCGRQRQVRRFARFGSIVAACDCGGHVTAGPLGARTIMPAADLRACWDLSLAEIGVEAGAAVGMAEEDDWTWFFPK
jgi:molybdopterin/thiamine biosynthesis adenylyltransferase